MPQSGKDRMDFAEQVKSQIDIVRTVGEYVRLRKAGTRFVGLCPFHTEKTPSFGVNPRGFYKCFGCGAGGDVIKFVMEVEGLSFWEALKSLAERNGIPLPKRSETADTDAQLRGALYRMHEIALELFRAGLYGPAGADARAYLARRGVTQGVAERFGVGFAESSGSALLRRFEQEGFSAAELEASGLVRRRQEGGGYYDAFRGRLMFPIHSESAKIIAFAGRALRDGDEPKYLNSPETPIYKKNTVLYNLNRAKDAIRKQDRAVLVEGYMDVIGVVAGGVEEVVATCGTALTNPQVRTLRRHSENVVVNFDPDVAGANATERSIQILLDEHMRVRVLTLEDGLDPDEFIKERGAETYRKLLSQAGTYFHWLADRARVRFDMRSADGRLEGFRFLLPAIQKVPDRLERAAIAEDVADYLGVDKGLVLDQFRKSATDRSAGGGARPAAPAAPPLERMLLLSLLASAEARGEVMPRLAELAAFRDFRVRSLLEAMREMDEAGVVVDYLSLEGRVAEPDRTLLREIVTADEMGEAGHTAEQARACLRELETAGREAQRAALRAQLKAAERAGDTAEALRLMGELGRLRGDAATRGVVN